ncbi:MULTISPECIES: trehalose-phosphatase [Brevibacterium]|uniref:Trehalose-phosphate phosphatase n=1 Tax=Brevibacterium casei TaxID=33889 RepID=A0A7T3ZZH2_9MICO|nr:trehalose-phosphatase [Brevibacterium casei]QQB14537.1 trehalose-phosphatase [Brevibacterium casei]
MTSDSTSMPPAVSDPLVPPLVDPGEIDLRPLAEADVLLVALDFDGVLAPLQDDPSRSRVVPASAEAIAELAGLPRTQLALVSGRDVETLRRLASPPPETMIVGSHGAEIDLGDGSDDAGATPTEAPGAEVSIDNAGDSDDEAAAEQRAAEASALTNDETALLAAIDDHLTELARVSDRDGFDLRIEYKPYSRTVHTRGMAPGLAKELRTHVVAVQSEHGGIRVIEGHDITELAVSQATKGTGIRALVGAVDPTAALYLGDDITDEDAFAELADMDDELTGVGIKVGEAPTQAEFRVADPDAVAALLTRLAEQRRGVTAAAGEPHSPAGRDQE